MGMSVKIGINLPFHFIYMKHFFKFWSGFSFNYYCVLLLCFHVQKSFSQTKVNLIRTSVSVSVDAKWSDPIVTCAHTCTEPLIWKKHLHMYTQLSDFAQTPEEEEWRMKKKKKLCVIKSAALLTCGVLVTPRSVHAPENRPLIFHFSHIWDFWLYLCPFFPFASVRTGLRYVAFTERYFWNSTFFFWHAKKRVILPKTRTQFTVPLVRNEISFQMCHIGSESSVWSA